MLVASDVGTTGSCHVPASNRLYQMTNPSSSQKLAFMQSRRLLTNTIRLPLKRVKIPQNRRKLHQNRRLLAASHMRTLDLKQSLASCVAIGNQHEIALLQPVSQLSHQGPAAPGVTDAPSTVSAASSASRTSAAAWCLIASVSAVADTQPASD